MSPLDVWIIDELIKLKIVRIPYDVQTIIWFPVAPYNEYSCAVRLKTCPEKHDVIISDLFEKIDCIGNYVNVKIKNSDLISKVFKTIMCYIDKPKHIIYTDVIVEHTSLTPVYPINLATFRSSVIGNALVSTYREQGSNVSSHYLVSDTARNVDLVLKRYSIESVLAGKTTQKNDHTCGIMFCESLKNIGKLSDNIDLKKMFPYSANASMSSNISGKYSVESLREYCDFCLQGHIETLSNANISVDSFDYESVIIQTIKNNYTLEKDLNLPRDIKGTYLFNNCLYYFTLSKNNCIVFSVISYRQKIIIEKSLSLLKSKNIYPVFFNDIVIKKNNQVLTDSIKEGIFHTVDKYIDEASSFLGISNKAAYEALKLLFLSVRNSDKIQLDCQSFTDLKKYVDILDFIKNAIDEIEQSTEISAQDISLAKKLINVFNEYLFKSITKEPKKTEHDIYKLVAQIESIIHFIKVEFYIPKNPINHKILISTKRILIKTLCLLGI